MKVYQAFLNYVSFVTSFIDLPKKDALVKLLCNSPCFLCRCRPDKKKAILNNHLIISSFIRENHNNTILRTLNFDNVSVAIGGHFIRLVPKQRYYRTALHILFESYFCSRLFLNNYSEKHNHWVMRQHNHCTSLFTLICPIDTTI